MCVVEENRTLKPGLSTKTESLLRQPKAAPDRSRADTSLVASKVRGKMREKDR